MTIFFVSHDPGAVRALCSRAILLNAGRIESDGKPADVLNHYQKLIMAREHDYDKVSAAPDEDEVDLFVDEQAAALHYTFRHGDGSAPCLLLGDGAGEFCVHAVTRFHRDQMSANPGAG